MKILVVSSNTPSWGGRIISFYRIAYLAGYNSIKLVCFDDMNIDSDCKLKLVLEGMGVDVYLIKKILVTACLNDQSFFSIKKLHASSQ